MEGKTNGEFAPSASDVTILVRTSSKNMKHLNKCVKSIDHNTDGEYHVIVIANGGLPDIPEWEESAPVDVYETHKNYGAVRATNLGMQLAMVEPSKYILVLDDDTEVPEGDRKWLERWVSHFEQDESVGAVGATSDYTSGLQNIASTPRTYTKEASTSVEGPPAQKGPVDASWLISFACMYSKRALRRALPPWIGHEELQVLSKTSPEKWAMAMGGMIKDDYQPITYLWDERFTPGNWEDVDISIRLVMAGYRLRIARDIYIHHTGSQTFGDMGFNELVVTNQKKGLEKWGPEILQSFELVGPVNA